MSTEDSISLVCQYLGIGVKNNNREEQLRLLREEINRMLIGDFDRLVSILYRIDVDEYKLRQLLIDQPGEDAAKLIADLLIQRQEQKIKTRSLFGRQREDMDEEERW